MKHHRSTLTIASLLLLGAGPVFAQGGITFQNIAGGGGAGLSYSRVASDRNANLEAFLADGIMQVPDEYAIAPIKPHGSPGVAVLDYDRDGDLDLYVTNGPGAANSLFANQLRQTGQLAFVDVATAAGVDATDQDSQGVCYGDTDNDGDSELLVLGSSEPNRLFENLGNGTFRDITSSSGVGGLSKNGTTCSMGDVNSDGLLDILVANTFDFTTQAIFALGPPFFHSQHMQLLVNEGGNSFEDVSASSGIQVLANLIRPGGSMPTWAAALVDMDLDGDLDIVAAQEQRVGAGQAGFNRLFRNDGTGHFTDATFAAGLNRIGSWHGLSFGDLNCDGALDFFSTNVGDYAFFNAGLNRGRWSGRWFLGRPNGTFADPGPGALLSIPNGWGNSILDYDNDGDLDIVLQGGQDTPLFWDLSNPGIVLNNQGCSAQFTWDSAALAGTDHLHRAVDGVATGDLNGDGFVDLVSVAGFVVPSSMPLVPIFSANLGTPFDPTALMGANLVPTADPNQFQWTGFSPLDGTLAVEISSGNGNGWVDVNVVGSVGITQDGKVNRDGIGAVVRFTPDGGQPVLKPVVGGSSYASQDSLTAHFGLGNAQRGTVEVLWPSGTRNVLYDVESTERIVFPEIPCSVDGDWRNQGEYVSCLRHELKRLENADIIDHQASQRFFHSAKAARNAND